MKKITAGDGYLYLVRQVAVGDGVKGRVPLADYYALNGESPGRWWGAGLDGLDGPDRRATARPGSAVTEDQMRALFGCGFHPDAERIMREALLDGAGEERAIRMGRLGRPYMDSADPALTDLQQGLKDALADWRSSHGLADRDPVPEEERRRIWSDVGRRVYTETHGRTPTSARELNGFLARETRGKRQPVAGFDITFSPSKSVSVLWALGSKDVADQVRAIHDRAVKHALATIERDFLFTREGARGVRQVPTQGLIAALFEHRDSRAGDPDLHTHAPIANKVQTLEGKWLSIDGHLLYQALVTVSECYNDALKAGLEEEMGLSFRPVFNRPDTPPVWEIDGIDDALIAEFSARRREILVCEEQLTAQFRAEHGRLPTAEEGYRLAQTATLRTRPDKGSPRTLTQLRSEWMDRAVTLMGSQAAVEAMVGRALDPQPARPEPTAPRSLEVAAEEVLRSVTDHRAVFQDTNVRAAAHRWLRACSAERRTEVGRTWGVDSAVDVLVAALTDAAVARATPLSTREPMVVPQPIRRPDGSSPWERAHSELFSTDWILAAEATVLEAAGRRDGRTVRDVDVTVALLRAEADGTPLNQMQRRLVEDLARSGRRVQLALAPAGSGKTTAMAALAGAWEASGGNVVGLSHQAIAAAELRQALGGTCPAGTIASITRGNPAGELSRVFWDPDDDGQPWLARQIGADTLIVVDEAGMAGTEDLAFLTGLAARRGASIRLVGDTKQLAAISAGGVLRDVEREHGAVTLDELMRFQDPSEAAATIGLRNGDHDALGFHLDRGRVHAVVEETVVDTVFKAWCDDVANGWKSLMMAFRVDTVKALNLAARNWLLTSGRVSPGAAVQLRDGTVASVGDTVATRQNDKDLRLSRTDFVRNRDRWTVTEVHQDGSLRVRNHRTERTITLPADYAAAHVELAYASTINGAQGCNVNRSHTIITGAEYRNGLYVAASRGRQGNHLYAVMDSGDPDDIVYEPSVWESTPVEILERVLDRDGEEMSATTARRQSTDPFVQLAHDANVYADVLPLAGRAILGLKKMRVLEDAVDQAARTRGMPGLPECEAWTALVDRLVIISGEGGDPVAALTVAIDERPSGGTPPRDQAAVLHWRLGAVAGAAGPMSWLDPIPQPIADHPEWGPFIRSHAALVRAEADAVH
ncbi:MAG: relaxase domain-containing protein, partial [Propionibacteriaceae bacterium]|nr:relaxase domain-containing protein [Propionibacteriaceae bacterium]